MSDDLARIHEQTSVILEDLYDKKGQPEELDEAFIQEYFKLVKDNLDLQVDEEDANLHRGPSNIEAKLSQTKSGLVEVAIPFDRKKFVVSQLASVKILPGSCTMSGYEGGIGDYLMTTIIRLKVPKITIKSDSGIVIFVGTPNSESVTTERGHGKWETLKDH